MSSRHYQTILLDAGGVILDETEQEKIHRTIAVDIIRDIDNSFGAADYNDDIAESVYRFVPNAYQYVYWKQCTEHMATFDRLYRRHMVEYRRRRLKLRINDGLEDQLRRLSRIVDIGIAGMYGAELFDLLESNGLLRYFTYRFTQDDFNITKPDPRYLDQICKRCGVEPTDTIMVGDRIDMDIIPAKMLGMATIRVKTGLHREQQPRLPREYPDIEIASLADLGGAVESLSQ